MYFFVGSRLRIKPVPPLCLKEILSYTKNALKFPVVVKQQLNLRYRCTLYWHIPTVSILINRLNNSCNVLLVCNYLELLTLVHYDYFRYIA